MPDVVRLVHTAVMVRSQAPDAWEAFTLAMREYAAQMAADMVRCPTEHLFKAQGMAQTAHDLAQTLMNAPSLYEQTQSRGRHGRQP